MQSYEKICNPQCLILCASALLRVVIMNNALSGKIITFVNITMITSQINFDLKPHTTFGLPARCSKWVEYTSASELPEVFSGIGEAQWMSIGAGSNLVFAGDFDGIVIRSCDEEVEITRKGDSVHVIAGAGLEMDNLIARCCDMGIGGLENLSGIPGTVGASAVQNVGAYGVEAKDVIGEVCCFDTVERRFINLDNSSCAFTYRDSLFKRQKNRYVVTRVTYILDQKAAPVLHYTQELRQLNEEGKPSPRKVREAILALRASKLPDVREYGSAGSFFKNPCVSREEYEAVVERDRGYGGGEVPHYVMAGGSVKIPAAWLIERCGFKGLEDGNVGVWPRQPLVLYNVTGKARGSEVLALARLITDAVLSRYGITLFPEAEIVGSC